jgi:soluble P-type ATPase
MLTIDIPGFGTLDIRHLVSDFTGTLSVDGILLPEVKELLADVGRLLNVHVLTADTFRKAHTALKGIDCTLTVLSGADFDRQKEAYVRNLGPEQVVAIGNGNNDRLMLKAARLGIAVIEGEGCAVSSLANADIAVRNIRDALGLLLNPKRCTATLRT